MAAANDVRFIQSRCDAFGLQAGTDLSAWHMMKCARLYAKHRYIVRDAPERVCMFITCKAHVP